MSTQNGISKPFLSVREVAEYLDIDYKTVYRLVRKGEIPAVKVGGVYRVGRKDLTAYLEQQRVQVGGGDPAGAKAVCAICGKQLPVPSAVAKSCPSCGKPICHACAHLHPGDTCLECRSAADKTAAEDEGLVPEPSLALEERETALHPSAARYMAMEKAFFGRLEANLLSLERVSHPNGGKKIKLKNALGTRREKSVFDEPALLQALTADAELQRELKTLPRGLKSSLPGNLQRSYTLALPAGGKEGLRVFGQFWCPLDRIVRGDRSDEPLGLGAATRIIDTVADRIEKEPFHNVLGIASPTGFTDECRDLVQGKSGRWKIVIPKLLILLVDLVELLIYVFGEQRQWAELTGMFSFTTRSEVREEIKKRLPDLLRGEDSITASAVAREFNLMPREAAGLMQDMAKDGEFGLLRLSDGDLVLYKRV